MAVSVSPQNRVDVSDLYVALFGRAPDGEGLGYWSNELAGGKTLAQVADAMFNTVPARAFYPTFQTNSEIINSFYTNVLGRTADTQGAAYWTGELNKSTATPGSIITQMIAAVKNFAPSGKPADVASDAAGTASKTLFLNKESLALAYGLSNGSIAGATNALTGAANSINLTVAADVLNGTSGKDMFTANVLQNAMGAQVNSLGSGDKLNGGGGTDSLIAKITAGAYINGNSNSNGTSTSTSSGFSFSDSNGSEFSQTNGFSQSFFSGEGSTNTFSNSFTDSFNTSFTNTFTSTNTNGTVVTSSTMPIEPETKSIEIVKFQAAEAALVGAGKNTQVYVNAKDMEDATQMWSSRSDADLTIQNLTTKGLPSLKSQTLGMEYTGNADSSWGASDYTVYYDQDYLTAGTSRTDAIEIRIVNNLELKVNGKGLVAFEKVSFLVGTELITVDITPAIRDLTGPAAYNALVVAIQAQLTALKITGVTVSVLPVRTAVFTDDLVQDGVTFPRGSESGTYTPILLTSVGASLGRGQAQVDNTTLNFNGLNTQLFATNSTNDLVTVNVALEKVGLAGDGGTFIAGSMNKTEANIWNAKNTVVGGTTSGIQQFDVSVGGNNTKSSSLAGMHSTNNNLKVVNVVSGDTALLGGTFADLTIGNSNTAGYDLFVQFKDKSYEVVVPTLDNQFALKDVQTFNAAGLKGDLDLTAALTQEVTAKYLNVIDNAANPAADNVGFTYTSGVGNDYINLYLDPANLEQPGTATREDMSLTISTGLGKDEVVVSTGEFGGDKSSLTGPNFYENQHINANLKMVNGVATGQLLINTGSGDDVVRTLGFGDYAINAGSDVDTVYLDNTGDRAFWTINDVNTSSLGNLLSKPAVPNATKIANLSLNVSFKGYDSVVPVGGSSGSIAGVSVNDLTINQAIKAAINNDPVLNKLLIAEDGPGRTLVITSLIDGQQQDANAFSDVVVSLSNTPLTAQQSVAAFALSPAQATALGFGVATTSGFGATLGGRFDANLEIGGNSSRAISDNLVVGGLGNDILVLGTGFASNDTVGYSGFGNGTDSIVNFDSKFTPAGAPVFNGGSKEVVRLVFSPSDGDPAAETIIFDGVTVTLASPTLGIIPALDVASQFVNEYYAAAATNGYSAVLGASQTVAGNEVATMTAVASDADLTAGQQYIVAGLTYTSTGVTTQAQLAAAFANLASGSAGNAAGLTTGTYTGSLTGYSTGSVATTSAPGTSVVTFTSTVVGDVLDLADSGSGAAAATIAVTTQGSAGYTGRIVTLTRDVNGATPDVNTASFTGNYFEAFPGPVDGNGFVAVTVTTQGQDVVVTPGTSSTYTVSYTTATTSVVAAGSLSSVVGELANDGALTLATKAAAVAPAGFTAGSVVTAPGGASHSVTFTATTSGESTFPTDVSYGLGTSPGDGVEGTFTSTAGVNAVTTPPVSTPGVLTVSAGSDVLDFSFYGVKAVFVGTTLVKGALPILGETYIQMTESATNDGEYTMSQFTEAGALGPVGDTLVGIGVIGIADFGVEQTFTSGNFVI